MVAAKAAAGVLWACVLGSSLSFIDGSVVNVSLPAMAADLKASGEQVQWIINGYMLPLAALFSAVVSLGSVGLQTFPALLAGLLAGSPLALVVAILLVGPPLLWLVSFFPLRRQRRLGWRLFALASVLATLGALWTLQIFNLAFDLLFVYAAIQARGAYWR